MRGGRDTGEVNLLGTIEVCGPLGRGAPAGSLQRTLVGLLALRPGEVVARSRIIDALWGDDPPRTAVKTLYSHVVRIRQVFDACGLPAALATRSPGYVLSLPPDCIDAFVFEEHVRRARHDLACGEMSRAAHELRTGLELWRGDAFTDGRPTGWGAAEVFRLHEVRLTAHEELCMAELSLGRHGAAVADLEHLLARYPLRERLVELLMVALYRCGRTAEALDVFQRLRARLAEDLGVDPGSAVQRLHTAILRNEPVGSSLAPAAASATVRRVPVPAQLPRRVGHFIGRTAELAALDRAGNRIVVVLGLAGMGKTALAVHWAHLVRDRFPDGQLFLDLGGHDPAGGLSPAEALDHLLRGLGVPASRVPTTLLDRIGLYRSLLAAGTFLVFLDNAASVGQVLPLIPGDEASLVVVTSRHQLAGLATHHAIHLVGLDVLRQDEALDLLDEVLGSARMAREPAAAAGIVQLCGRMPLALRIAAAKLGAQPHQRAEEFAAELAEQDRLEALAVDGDPRSIRTVFASAYRALSAPAATVFRRLSLHPGSTFAGPQLAAAITGWTPRAAGYLIDELTAAHLIAEVGEGRHAFHDLIRLYARERCKIDDIETERGETAGRLFDWYLAVAASANRTLDRARNRVEPTLRYQPSELPFADSREDALAFLDLERDNLVAVVRSAAEHGHHTTTWHLTYLLASYFEFRGHWTDRVEICRYGLAAATFVGDPFAEGLMESSLGVACCEIRQFNEALGHLRAALALSRVSDDRRGQGTAHNNIAVALTGLGRLTEAAEAFLEALKVHTENDHRLGIALALNNIGDTYARLGEMPRGLDYLDQALSMIRSVGSLRFEAVIVDNIGQALLRVGEPAAALSRFEDALRIRREIGDRRYEADTLNHIAMTHLEIGDHAAALDLLGQALTISRDVADPHREAIALNNLGHAHLSGGDSTAAREQLSLALALRTRVPDADEEANVHRNLAELARSVSSRR